MSLVLLVDFGSTYTKVVCIDLDKELLVGGAQEVSTVTSDITIGLRSALSKLQIDGQPIDINIAEVWQQFEGLYFEYSMNEKVALDGAIGAAWAGIRAMAAMKHLGLNVAADPLHHASYRDLKGLVILNGGDPGMQSSQTEQDNRFYSLHTHFPIIEPSSVQEAKDFTIKAFELSEEFTIPFMLNLPSALLHGLGELELGELPEVFPAKGRFTSIYQNTKWDTEFGRPGRHKVLLDREAAVAEYAATSKLNRIIKGGNHVENN